MSKTQVGVPAKVTRVGFFTPLPSPPKRCRRGTSPSETDTTVFTTVCLYHIGKQIGNQTGQRFSGASCSKWVLPDPSAPGWPPTSKAGAHRSLCRPLQASAFARGHSFSPPPAMVTRRILSAFKSFNASPMSPIRKPSHLSIAESY